MYIVIFDILLRLKRICITILYCVSIQYHCLICIHIITWLYYSVKFSCSVSRLCGFLQSYTYTVHPVSTWLHATKKYKLNSMPLQLGYRYDKLHSRHGTRTWIHILMYVWYTSTYVLETTYTFESSCSN